MDAGNLIFSDQIAFFFMEWLDGKGLSNPVFICDDNTYKHCFPILDYPSERVIVIPAGETFKNFETLQTVLDRFLEFEVRRSDLIVNLGGGVVSDLGGFAASVYRRGIPYINIPTTLLAMADAAIGGKTGIDFRHLKNYIGSFRMPEEVLISTEFLSTLPEDQIQAAKAEIIKTAIMCDADLYDMLRKDSPLEQLVHRCAHQKALLVNQDFEDKGVRQLLNFGHTVGHAYESYRLAQGTPVLHGNAVAKGMLEELELAVKMGLLTESLGREFKGMIHGKTGITALTESERAAIKRYLQADKKNTDNKITYSLPTGIGQGLYGIQPEAKGSE